MQRILEILEITKFHMFLKNGKTTSYYNLQHILLFSIGFSWFLLLPGFLLPPELRTILLSFNRRTRRKHTPPELDAPPAERSSTLGAGTEAAKEQGQQQGEAGRAAQAEEIDYLRVELDKMRQRTFPSFTKTKKF